jgi:hypothetical protein
LPHKPFQDKFSDVLDFIGHLCRFPPCRHEGHRDQDKRHKSEIEDDNIGDQVPHGFRHGSTSGNQSILPRWSISVFKPREKHFMEMVV